MRKLTLLITMLFLSLGMAWAQTPALKVSTKVDAPEYVYRLKSANNLWMTSCTSPTETEANSSAFAFFKVDGENAYKIFSVERQMWVSYPQTDSYTDGKNKAVLVNSKDDANAWYVTNTDGYYRFAPYRTDGKAASRYWNWYGGIGSNPDNNNYLTIGYYAKSDDGGCKWSLNEISNYDLSQVTDCKFRITINGVEYSGIYKGIVGKTKMEGQFDSSSWEGDTFVATMNKWTCPVSKEGGVVKYTTISSFNDKKLWHAIGDDIKVQVSAKAAYDGTDAWHWAIYPNFDNSRVTFVIKNIASGKYIYSEAKNNSSAMDNAATYELSNTPSYFVFDDDRDFRFDGMDQLYISINSERDEDVYLGVHRNTHGGTNCFFSVKKEINPVAQVDAQIFYTFAEAFEAATAGKTITLLANYTGEAIVLPIGVTLNKNGHTDANVTVKQPTYVYNFVYNDKVLKTQTGTVELGKAFPEIDAENKPFGVTASKPEGNVDLTDVDQNGNVAKNITVTFNLPFDAAADNASIEKWYHIQMHTYDASTTYNKYIQSVSATEVKWADNSVAPEKQDACTWGFIGNPYEGFKVVNYATGTAIAANQDVSAPVLNEAGVQWIVTGSSHKPDALHFCLKYPNGDIKYLNANAETGALGFWRDPDAGSTMWVTLRDINSEVTALTTLVGQAQALVEGWSGKVGELTEESKNAVATAITTAQAAISSKNNLALAKQGLEAAIDNVQRIEAPTEVKVATLDDLKVALADNSNELPIVITAEIVIPEGTTVELDLNGKTVNSVFNGTSTTNHIYALRNKGTLTINDSKGNGSINSRGIYNHGTLTLNAGAINAIDGNGGYAVNNQSGSTFVMNGGVVAATNEDDHQSSSGGYDATALKVPAGCIATLNGGTINNVCDFTFAIDAAGTLNVPATSTITVNGTHGAIAVSGGETTINAGTYTIPKDNYSRTDNVLYVSGGSLIVNGGTFIGDNDTASGGSCLCDEAGKAVVNGGTFKDSSGGDVWGTTGTTIKGGTFENLTDKQLIADGYELGADGTVVKKAAATINGVEYASIGEAVAALKSNETLVITSDITPGANEFIELNGKTNVTLAAAEGVVIKGNIQVGHHPSHSDYDVDRSESTFTVDGLTVEGTLTVCSNDAALVVKNTKAAQITVKTNREGMDIDLNNNTADGSMGTATNSYGMYLVPNATGYNLKVDNNTFKNINSHAFVVQGSGDGSAVTAANSIVVTNNKFESWGTGGKDDRAAFKIWADTKYAPAASDLAGTTNAMRELVDAIAAGGNTYSSTANNTVQFDAYGAAGDAEDFPDPMYAVAMIGEQGYATIKDAVAAVKESETITILAGTYSEGTIMLPATLKNVTIKGAEGAELKDMTISAADGNAYSYVGLTFDGITFDNSRILLTGWRNGDEIIKDLVVTNCTFKNLNDNTNIAPIHINKEANEPVNGFTFTNNVIDGATGGSKSGIYAQVTGEVKVENNIINDVSFRPYVIQVTTDDGIADNFTVTGNTFSGSAVGRAQGLGNKAEGTDNVNLVVSNNIFKDITGAQQICYWNFNPETTTADLSKNYYDIDIVANPSKIYFNSSAADNYALRDMNVFPIYTELNENGTINTESAFTPKFYIAKVGENSYETLSEALAAATEGATVTLLSNTEESIAAIENVKLATAVAGGVTVKNTCSDWINMTNVAIGAGVTLDMKNVYYTNAGVNVIEGTLNATTLYNANNSKTTVQNGGKIATTGMIVNRYHTAADAGIYVYGDGDASTVEVSCANSIGTYSGTFYTKDAVVNGNMLWIDYLKDSTQEADNYSQSKPVFENSTVNITKELRLYKDATLTLVNSDVTAGTVQIRENATPTVNVDANSTVKATSVQNLTGASMDAVLDENGFVSFNSIVAKIGGNKYYTLEAAFAAATEGQTITLVDDATPVLNSQRAITKAAVIDLGSKTLTLTEDDLYFGTTTFKNGTIVVDPSVKPSTAVFWMFANQTLTFDNVKIVATGVTGTYLIGLDGNNSDLNLLNGSEILVENTTALDLDIICVNASTGNDIKVVNSKVNVTNLDGRVFFRGNYTVAGNSVINLAGITKAGFRIEAGQTLSIEDTSIVTVTGEPRDGGIHLTDATATYTKAETATVDATVNRPSVVQIGENKYSSLADAIVAAKADDEIVMLADVTLSEAIVLPAGVIFNGNNKTVTGTIQAGGDLTFKGHTIVSTFSAGYKNTITIGEGASLKATSGRMTVSYGNIINVIGNLENAKTADKAAMTPSLELTGISFNGDGGGVQFNVTNAYVKLGDSSTKDSGATGKFNINFNNSIVDFTKTLKTYMPTATGLAPEFNLSVTNSVMTIASHFELWLDKTSVTLDNSDLTVGGSFANAGTVAVKGGANFVVKAPIMSSHGGNTGSIVVEEGTFELQDSNEDWQNAGVMKVAVGGKFITNDFKCVGEGKIVVDAANLQDETVVVDGNGVYNFEAVTVVENGGSVDVSYENGDVTLRVKTLVGAGTEESPYLIQTADDLVFFRNSVNGGETKYSAPGVWVALGADIDMTGLNWVGIGSVTAEHGFMGNFDGKNFKIKNLTITNPALDSDGYAYAGFFSVTEGTDKDNQNVIKNLIIENVTITTEGHIVSAAIAYPYYTIVDNVKVCGNIAIQGGDYTAGVLAYTRRCVNASNLSIVGNDGSFVKGNKVVGGVISDIQMNGGLVAEYKNFSAEGITVSGKKSVGGISGIIATQTLNGATVTNVTLYSEDGFAGVVAGRLGGTSTIANVVVADNVTGATTLIGAAYDGAKAVEARIGDTYYATFAAAYTAAQADETITLLAPVTVATGETLTLDKNVNITYTSNKAGEDMFTNRGTLNISAGKITYVNTDATGANVTVSTISTEPGSVLNVTGGVIENKTVKADGSSIYSYAIDMLTNGNLGDVTATISGGTVSSDYMAIRQFNNGTACKNTLKITGGTIYGAKRAVQIHMDNNAAYTTFTGGKIEAGANGYSLCNFAGSGNLSVTGGEFIGTVYSKLEKFIAGGIYSEEIAEEYLAEHFICQANNDGTYGVIQDPNYIPVLVINDAEGKDFVNASVKIVGTLTYKRTLPMANTWMPLYVPFKISLSEEFLENYDIAYFNDVHGHDDNGDNVIDRTTIELIKISDPSKTIKANYPLVIRALNDKALELEITMNKATLYPSEENTVTVTSALSSYEIKGTYQKHETIADNQRVWGKDTNGDAAWGKLKEGSVLNPYRLILTITSRDDANLPFETIRMRVIGEDGEDGITYIEGVHQTVKTGDEFIYDLQGRRVFEPTKGGIYIINGKKVYFK